MLTARTRRRRRASALASISWKCWKSSASVLARRSSGAITPAVPLGGEELAEPFDAGHELAAVQDVARPRVRDRDRDDLLDRAGAGAHHHDAVGQERRLLQVVGDEEHGLRRGFPDAHELEVHVLAS